MNTHKQARREHLPDTSTQFRRKPDNSLSPHCNTLIFNGFIPGTGIAGYAVP